MTTKRKIAVFVLRAVCVVTAGIALTACYGAIQTGRRLQVARAERPVSLAMNLSVTSQTTHKIQRLHDLGHGMEVWLEIPGGFGTDSEARGRLAGLRGEVSASMDKGGWVIELFHGSNVTVAQYEDVRGCALLGRLQTHVTGSGEVQVKVIDGVPEMAGVPARMFVRNSYCGLEQLNVTILWVIAAAFCFVAVVTGLVARGLVRTANQTRSTA